MCATTLSRLFRWACIVTFAVAPIAAFAQAPSTILVACQNAGNCPTGGHNSPYTDLQEAIDDAVADSVVLNQQVLLLVVGGPWVGNFTIPADANVRILGVAFNTQQTITIIPGTGATGGTFTLSFTSPLDGSTDTTTDLDFDATAAEVQAALEALTTIGTGNVTVTGPDGGPYDVNFTGALANVAVPILVPDDALLTPADAFVLVLSSDGPFSTIIQGPGTGAVLTIDGSTPESRDAGVDRDRLIIEGLTFTGGDRGIRVNGGSDTTAKIEPVLNRLYIRENGAAAGDAGVAVEGSARPLIVNCSVSENGGDGVRVIDGAGPGLADADILHCTIVGNDDNGVFVGAGNTVSVRNTLVYQNGTGTGEGGIVFEDNAFIDPDFGPLDGLDIATGNPIDVNIFGSNLVEGATTLVSFGPPANPGTAAIAPYGAQTDAQLSDVQLPPAYNGIPGQVDVTLQRGDGAQIVVPNGFTYTADLLGTPPVPIVWQVDPGWGPINNTTTAGVDESAIDVYVLGAFFDRDVDVFFDIDDDDILDANEQSPRVQWISSGRLFVRVPSSTTANRVDVFVRNNLTGQVSPAGPLEEYEYRAGFGIGPDIASIIPNTIDTTAGSAGTTAEQPDILGGNFVAGAVVKIGGIVCPYASLTANRITDIVIPVSEFGGGGVYDVEVINPDGLNDILPRGFSYFADSTPSLDALPWRVSNFVERGTATTLSLLGHGLDFDVDLVENTTATVFGDDLQPIAQREIVFGYPADTNGLGLAAGVSVVPINVVNDGTASGSASTTPFDTTNLMYTEVRTNQAPGAGRAVFFAINSATISTVAATDVIQLDIENYRLTYNIFVGEVQVPAASITVITAPNPPVNFNGVIQFPAPVQPEGVFGPVDIRVESPIGTTENQTGELLYTIAEDAYSYRRAGTGEFPQVSAVTPNTVPDNGPQTIQFTGQNFIGPVASGVDTRVLLDGDATINGNELDLSAVAGAYSIDSIAQITKVLDLDAVDPGITIPRDVPVDVVVEQFDAVNGVVLTDGTNPLRSRLLGAVTFLDAVAAPAITAIVPPSGPVGGSDTGAFPVQITGTNFGVAEPIVLIGSSQANVTGWTAATIDFELPAAPNGLPGIYDVTVIRTDDFVEATLVDGFTYYMDGAPTVVDLSPNHKTFDSANPPATVESVFITIYGYNFDDDVRITFSDRIALPVDSLAMDDSTHPGRIRVLSPNEIVVEITTADLGTILDASDYTAGVATMGVTVQNKADTVLVGSPEEASLTSAPPEPFLVFSDNRGDMEILTPELLFNDVYLNNQDDYVNVSPGAGSISVEPVIMGTPWVGKLFPDPIAHPLLDTAATFTDGEPYTLTDFELDARPSGDGPEIGADEILEAAELEICSWYFARVTPNPVGVTAPNQLTVELQYTGNCGGTPFIVPQGGDPRDAADRINLQLYQNPGNGYYIFTNQDSIKTLLDEQDGVSGVSAGDLIADGHAAIYMQNGSNIIGLANSQEAPAAILAPDSDHLTDGGVISGDAITGRHFLIDTVPPRMYLEAYGGAVLYDDIFAGNVVLNSNDVTSAIDHNALTHPAGAPDAVNTPYRPSLADPPDAANWPADDGGIYFRDVVPTIENGLQVMFNHGSIANWYPDIVPTVLNGETLDIGIRMVFIDPPVTNPDANPQVAIPGLDFYTGSLIRQVAGFPLPSPAALTEAAGAAADENILLQGYGRWYPDATIGLTVGAAKTATFTTSNRPGTADLPDNEGVFDPTLYPGDSAPSPGAVDDPGNDMLTVDWQIFDLAPAAASQVWHVNALFVGED
ncbi:MAG: right-handed parallel beta-helix repeat-containing protein, partial [Candidatus Hydrogenedentes bacterium]|nr:right-handed parallel beta-helix repeat-containing protein [Candidatus Hydrogenedentota bacterium]